MMLRKPSQAELALIQYLVDQATIVDLPPEWIHTLSVSSMDDDGMGSLLLFPTDKLIDGREFGQCVSEYQFSDVDNVQVLASLYLDQAGQLFELDVWKVNFTPLIHLPERYP